MLFGFVIQWVVFRTMMLQVVAHSVVIYLLISLLGRRSSTVVFLYSFGFLLA